MKKLNKLFAILVAMAMVLSLGVSMAFAVDNPTTATDKITISKKITVAQGLAVPTEFTFKAEKKALDDDTSATELAKMPELANATTTNLKDKTAAEGQTTIIGNTAILTRSGEKDDQNKPVYPHAGVYTYTLSEVKNDPVITGMTYDEKTYTADLYVDKDGNVTNIVIRENDEEGNPKADGKKDADDPKDDPDKPADPTTGDKESGVSFANTYKKVADDTDDPNDDGTDKFSFIVTKDVKGDHSDNTKQFTFNLEIDSSEAKTNYKASDVNIVVKKGADTIELKDGKYTFTLAAGETVTVDGAPVGTTYKVTETQDAKYAGVAVVTEKGAVNTNKGAENTEGLTKDATNMGENVVVTDALVAEGTNSSAFTNMNVKDETPPEGILISNLPYIALALVAIGGLVAYVVVRRRNADEA